MQNENEYIEFEEGLFGFEDRKKFLPLTLEENNDTVLCLQSVEDENLSFIVMNPFMLLEDYNPVPGNEDYRMLGTDKEDELSFYVLCVVGACAEECTVNLKCPIVVNTVTRKARQVILDSEKYGFRHALKEFKKEEA